MISEDILTAMDILLRWSLTALVWASVIVLTWLVLRWAGRAVARKQARATWPNWPVDPDAPDGGAWDNDEPDDCGDQGGMPEPVDLRHTRPKAPQIGCGLPAGVKNWVGDMGPKDGD
ncbi:hypothetical protein LCGC14_2728460 [marine sediment metagenome]|uniref:Uncharacterized protein n=1 Tax=marine sediment metagenome TaxID=412755 RepID=A0A0F8Z820_9ZZZZ